MKLALTGSTGFVGSHLLEQALAAGHQVSALTRQPQPGRPGVDWVIGSLEDRGALHRLTGDADRVIHVAGVLNAPDKAGFDKGNVTGTLAILAAATASGAERFVHVSSLAAREPHLSLYGDSKARSEELVERSGLDWVIVRPPAVYGPGDRETFELFRMARGGLVAMPPEGRASYLHVEDLARLLLALADQGAPSRLILEPDDGRPGGWSHHDFGQALGQAVGVPAVRTLKAPRWLLRAGAVGDRLVRGGRARLTPDRVAYFCHPDWVSDRSRSVPHQLWQPRIPTDRGLEETARWYVAQGWLKPPPKASPDLP